MDNAMMTKTHNELRAERIVRAYLESHHWDVNRFGSSSDMWIDDPDRAQRCHDAAEYGGDGSTHREVIDDMRSCFRNWLKYGRTHGAFVEYPYRVEAIVDAHFDRLEQWCALHAAELD